MISIYDYYLKGYDNGIIFSYIPEFKSERQKLAFNMGYKDAKANLPQKEIDSFKRSFPYMYLEKNITPEILISHNNHKLKFIKLTDKLTVLICESCNIILYQFYME